MSSAYERPCESHYATRGVLGLHSRLRLSPAAVSPSTSAAEPAASLPRRRPRRRRHGVPVTRRRSDSLTPCRRAMRQSAAASPRRTSEATKSHSMTAAGPTSHSQPTTHGVTKTVGDYTLNTCFSTLRRSYIFKILTAAQRIGPGSQPEWARILKNYKLFFYFTIILR